MRSQSEQYAVSITGKTGDRLTVEIKPHCFFQARTLSASDTLKGSATSIGSPFVGQRPQKWGTIVYTGNDQFHCVDDYPSTDFDMMKRDWKRERVTRFDLCAPGETISFVVTFEKDCIWYGTIAGTGSYLLNETGEGGGS